MEWDMANSRWRVASITSNKDGTGQKSKPFLQTNLHYTPCCLLSWLQGILCVHLLCEALSILTAYKICDTCGVIVCVDLLKQHYQWWQITLLVIFLRASKYVNSPDQVWFILRATELLPLILSHRWGSNSNAGKMKQAWANYFLLLLGVRYAESRSKDSRVVWWERSE